MDNTNLILAFSLTLFAGLSTGIGSTLAFFSKRMNIRYLSGALGFSSGVMIYVSLIEIFPKANASLALVLTESQAYVWTTLSFFAGIAVAATIDKLVPSFENPHEPKDIDELDKTALLTRNRKLLKVGVFSAIAIAIHNFPEGLATFTGALKDPALGISIAVAVAIHNIPEGIAISVPMYFATGSKRKAFMLSFLSGLAEPVGAVMGYFLLSFLFNDYVFGIVFAAVAGIMVFISIDELLPTAEKYGEHHIAIYGMISGMAVMALSLIIFV